MIVSMDFSLRSADLFLLAFDSSSWFSLNTVLRDDVYACVTFRAD